MTPTGKRKRSNNASSNESEDSDNNSLDNTLLESLFFNEMMLMPEDSASGVSFLSSLLNDSKADADTQIEKALLRDFGVPGLSPAPRVLSATSTITSVNNPLAAPFVPAPISNSELQPPTYAQSKLSRVLPYHHQQQQQQQNTVTQQPLVVAPPQQQQVYAQIPPVQSHLQPAVHQNSTTQAYATTTESTITTCTSSVASTNENYPTNYAQGQSASLGQTLNTTTATDEEQKRNKLVSQFATLASRLGINLPSQIIQSLTSAANGASNDASAHESFLTLVKNSTAGSNPDSPNSMDNNNNNNGGNSSDGRHIERTLSIASFTSGGESSVDLTALGSSKSKRASAMLQSSDRDNCESSANASVTAEGSVNRRSADGSKALPYSKRRKKPRLDDCERRLASLKAENDMLKRHVATLSHKSEKFNQERMQAERKMKSMSNDVNAEPAELDAIVKEYTELYSDYGKRRHQELLFHLEQLQRLANPTNFTKMGLWTLGQQGRNPKKNPIAGILQKELDINAQQGKKIIEQQQKIRNVCSNIKECLGLLAKLNSLCEQKTKIFHDRMSKCREILTPRQVVKLLLWIDTHSAVLQKVCPGWGSENLHKRVT